MSSIVRPNKYLPGETIVSDEVNDDFDTIYTAINTDVAHLDAQNAFTGIPVLPAVDPTSDNQATRRKYVDDRTLGVLAKHVIPNDSYTINTTESDIGVGLTFTVPDLSDTERAVRLDVGVPAWSATNATNSTVLFLALRTSGKSVTFGTRALVYGNAYLGGTSGDFTFWLWDNAKLSAGQACQINLFASLAYMPAGTVGKLVGTADSPITLVASQV